jgi:hypothetical protein
MRDPVALRVLPSVLLLALALSACTRSELPDTPIPPAPRVAPTLPPAATAARATVVAPTAAPLLPAGTHTPSPTSGWQEVTGASFSLLLPASWTTLELTSSDADAMFHEFELKSKDLAKALGGPEALRGVELWAFAPAQNPAFTDNLNIRRLPLEGQTIERMSEVIPAMVDQYEEFSFRIIEADAGRIIDGLQAAYMRLDYELEGANAAMMPVTCHQYLIASEADLWILSFSAGPTAPANTGQVFASIAESFRVVQAERVGE